mmetsp:Transcript_11181/g.20250  ORF Transcript_11181/g.20250 Transcript_11181/m.20250 type:complete len:275 (-) Transcript_11181:80-904(-)
MDLGNLLLGLLHAGGHASLAQVPVDGELEEEGEVASVHDGSGDEVVVGDGAVSGVLVVVAREAYGDSDDHLHDLGDGDEEGVHPLGLHADGHQKVVAVHDGVDGVVHADEEEAGGGLEGVGVPAEEEDGHVVVPVEEDQGPLPGDDEVRVDKLEGLGVDEELDPEAGGHGPPVGVGLPAHILLDGLVEDVVEEVGDGPGHSHEGEGGEEEVPGGEDGAVGVSGGLLVLHVVLSAEDGDKVDSAEGEGNMGPGGLGPLVPVVDFVVLLEFSVERL